MIHKKTFTVTYTSRANRSAGDMGYTTKAQALKAFLCAVKPVMGEHDTCVNLQVREHVGDAWLVSTIAAKYVGETDVRIFSEFFRH